MGNVIARTHNQRGLGVCRSRVMHVHGDPIWADLMKARPLHSCSPGRRLAVGFFVYALLACGMFRLGLLTEVLPADGALAILLVVLLCTTFC